MNCLKCGKDGVHYVNAYDVTDSAGCSIDCSHCGQEHDASPVLYPDSVSLPLPLWQKALIMIGFVAAILAASGIKVLLWN